MSKADAHLRRAHAGAPARSSSARPTRRSSGSARTPTIRCSAPTLNAYDQAKTAGGIERRRRRRARAPHAARRRRQRPRRLAAQPGGVQQRVRAFARPTGACRRTPRRCSCRSSRSPGRWRAPSPDLARLLSVRPATTPALPLSIDEDPAVFAEPLKRRCERAAARLVRRLRRTPADGARHPRSLPCGAASLRGHRLHRRGGGAGLRSGADLAGLAAAAPLADRRARSSSSSAIPRSAPG